MLYNITFAVSEEERGIFYALFELLRSGVVLMGKQSIDDGSTYLFSLCMFEGSLNGEEKLVIDALQTIFEYEEISINTFKRNEVSR